MAKKKFYAVVVGYTPGIYKDWDSCKKSICGCSGQKYKGFSTEEEAIAWYRDNGGDMAIIAACAPKRALACEPTRPAALDEVIPEEPEQEPEDEIHQKRMWLIKKLNERLEDTNRLIKDFAPDLKSFCTKYPQFDKLSKAQKNAVQTIKGKSLLFAVPGSGKTTVLIARAGYLLYGQKQVSIKKDMLMNLTFTVAAANEMAKRFEREFHVSHDERPAFRTIHSFCYSEIIPLLRTKGLAIPPNLLNTGKQKNQQAMCADFDDCISDKAAGNKLKKAPKYCPNNGITTYNLLKEVLHKFKLSARDDTLRERISSVITSIKNRQLTPQEYENKVITINKNEYYIKEIFESYQEELAKNRCMDFDDMLQYSLLGLKEYPDVVNYSRL